MTDGVTIHPWTVVIRYLRPRFARATVAEQGATLLPCVLGRHPVTETDQDRETDRRMGKSYSRKAWVPFVCYQSVASTLLYTMYYSFPRLLSTSLPPISSPGRSAIPTLRWSISLCGAGLIGPQAPPNSRPQFAPTTSLISFGGVCKYHL
jgi:hypothetical protein